ncbi:MAG: hypothetical protein HYT29_01025 [Parcubacteria group bacterium]|nr:hypothetical protein [Parcubacteria group bacterium]
MSRKTFFILFSVLLLLVAGFFFAAFLLSRKEGRPLGEVLIDVAPFGEVLQDISFGGRTPTGDGEEPVVPDGAGVSPEKLPNLYKISAEPVSGATAFLRDGTAYIRYALLDTGHIYEYGATTTERQRVTNTTAPGIKEVFWGRNGGVAIVRYLDEGNIIKTFLGRVLLAGANTKLGESSGVLYGEFLADTISGLAVSPEKDRFFYLSQAGESVAGFVSSFGEGGGGAKRIFGFSFTEWLVSWPQKDTLVLTTKPSAHTDGFAYTMNVSTGALTKLLGGVRGLTTHPSPDLAAVLYSRGLRNRIDSFLLDTKTASVAAFPVSTLSEKCAWGIKEPSVVYCGVPDFLPQGYFPDDWYQGGVSFSDALWRVQTETGIAEKISLPERDVGESVDVIEPVLSPNDDFLFFINKKDSSLWSLKLGARF